MAPPMRVAMRIVNFLNPTLFDYNAPTELSTWVPFFHHWPRFGRSNHLDFSGSYGTSVFLVALPFVVVAVFCALVASLVNTFYGGVKRRGIRRNGLQYESDAAFSSESSSNDLSGAGCGRILGGIILFAIATHLIGLAFVANHFFYAGYSNVIDLSESASNSLTSEGAGVLEVVRTVVQRADNETSNGTLGFDALLFANTLLDAQEQFAKTISNVGGLTQQLRHFGNIAFWLAAFVYVVLVLGVMLLFSTAFPRRRQQSIAMAIYIIPLVVSWFCVAFITASASVAGDLCVQLSDFQKIVLVQSKTIHVTTLDGVNVTNNLLIKANVQCPQELVGDKIPLAETANALAFVLRSPVSISILQVLYPHGNITELEQVQEWIVPAMKKAVDCTIITRLAGQYMFALCSHRGPITALFVAWGSLLFLAIILTIAYLLTQFTYFEASRFLTPYIRPDEDIYEAISEQPRSKVLEPVGAEVVSPE